MQDPASCAAARPAQSWRESSSALSGGQPSDPAKQRREVLAVHVLHREEVPAVRPRRCRRRGNVGMRDRRASPHLGEEPVEQSLVRRERSGRNFSATG